MKTIPAYLLVHTYHRDPDATPTEIAMNGEPSLTKGMDISTGENHGVVTGFQHNSHGHLDDFYKVEVVWFKGPYSVEKETRYQQYNITDFMKFLDIEIVEDE